MPALQQVDTPQKPQQRKGFAALSLSCISAAAAETATYPIDAVKTQLQLQRSNIRSSNNSSAKPAGAYQLARGLLKAHGVSGLYAGSSPAVLRHFFYTGTRITLYEQLKASYAEHHAEQVIRTANSSSSRSSSSNDLLPKLLFGLTAGAVGQLVAVPADLIKVQMQADVRAVMSGRQQQRQFTSIRSVASALIRQHGLSGLWRGGLPAVQRAALVNLGELSTYDSAKQAISSAALLPAGLPTHLAASVCSGFVSAVISTPADVIKTRLMAQAVEGPSPQQRSQEKPSTAGAGVAAPPGAVKGTSTRSYSSGSSPARRRLCAASARAGAAARPAVQAEAQPAVQSAVQPAVRPAILPASSRSKGAAVTPGALAPPRAVLRVARSSMSSQHGGLGPFRHSTPQHYTGMVGCAVQTVKQEGLLALYKGFWPTWARLGPWQLVFWVTYEQLRSLANISAF